MKLRLVYLMCLLSCSSMFDMFEKKQPVNIRCSADEKCPENHICGRAKSFVKYIKKSTNPWINYPVYETVGLIANCFDVSTMKVCNPEVEQQLRNNVETNGPNIIKEAPKIDGRPTEIYTEECLIPEPIPQSPVPSQPQI